MKREEIKNIFPEATDEQIKSVMDLNGADIEKSKAKMVTIETELKEKNEALETLKNDFETLKANNATAEDYKTKYEAIVADNEAKKKQAEADRIAHEREENIANRFNAVVGDKKFQHEAVKQHYHKLFGEALQNKDFEGKSDADIFHDLTKDDKDAFVGVQVVKLAGGNQSGIMPSGKYTSTEEISKIKDPVTRQQEMLAHSYLYPELQNDN